ncbi:trypsin-like peptidase domain-containing protein [Pseudoponticoccus marisrubri]|uniref:Serine protease n=1 Tax=Pseudoponticoccus marisrubri TaxID=1685382 RepID=A0A0W7WQ32_9RHOB|nr:trypsin-like peptidase domain-containing protein [Pseudoponticoccus marisrubri]KUF12703.1 hypothetical protein AVJ23_03025 [Pseudoponticoccus marisrubri]
MRRLALLFALLGLSAAPASAQGLASCDFGFEVDTQSSAFQAMVVDGEAKPGFWLSINRAPSDVREIARFVGRMQICLSTPDGKPREITRNGRRITLDSPFVSSCTVALLPGNRLLTNRHCFHDPDLERGGFEIVQEARVNFNYTDQDTTSAVRTYRVLPRALAEDAALDAMVLQVIGGDANADLGGHLPLRMMTRAEPFQELRMIHHPGGDPQQYSTGTCQVHRRQSEIPPEDSVFRHTCESTGGSSGALLFDARTLAVVALHNQGGLSRVGDSFNGGHKIGPIAAALGLGFESVEQAEPERDPAPDRAAAATAALGAALIPTDPQTRMEALARVAEDFDGTPAAATAKRLQTQLRDELAAEQARQSERAEAERTQAAQSALEAALNPLDPTALRAVRDRFAGTEAARRAEAELDRIDAAETLERRANDALSAALRIDDLTRRIAQLLVVAKDFPETRAGLRAQDAAARYAETLRQERADPSEALIALFRQGPEADLSQIPVVRVPIIENPGPQKDIQARLVTSKARSPVDTLYDHLRVHLQTMEVSGRDDALRAQLGGARNFRAVQVYHDTDGTRAALRGWVSGGELSMLVLVLPAEARPARLVRLAIPAGPRGLHPGDDPGYVVPDSNYVAQAPDGGLLIQLDTARRCSGTRRMGIIVSLAPGLNRLNWVSPIRTAGGNHFGFTEDSLFAVDGGSCENDYLYEIDMATGRVKTREVIPSAQDAGDFTAVDGKDLYLVLYNRFMQFRLP